jgi:hypothetical protein
VARFGVIARADQSGLAAQTLAFANHLGASAVLMLELTEKGRGPSDWSQLTPGAETFYCEGWPGDDPIRWLVDKSDVVYTAECPYHDGLGPYCATRGVDLFLHANPELWRPVYGHGQPHVWAPSGWRMDLLPPETKIVGMPVDDPPEGTEPRSEVRSFLHVCSAAMEDRNGTAQVIDAIPKIRYPCDLYVGGYDVQVGHFPAELNPLVTVHKVGPMPDRWGLYDGLADALVLPRRYGGLSLPMLEAARFAMPIVGLRTDPFGPYKGVNAQAVSAFDATGGRITAFAANPEDLAAEMNGLLCDPNYARERSAAALTWARAQSWSTRGPELRAMMGLPNG